MHTLLRAFLCLLFVMGATSSGAAEDLSYFLPSGTALNPAIPTPESFFGFAVGEWHVRHDQLLAYLSALDEASDRIVLERYGRTHEQRSLVLLTVTHPRNHARLEEIRRRHIEEAMSPGSSPGPDAETPVVLWLGYSVHGNEASGAHAALLIAYYLAAAQGAVVEQLLSSTVIMLDPCLNPDGHDRFVTWVNGNRGQQPAADPATREHTEPWPSGRGNHYWFDLNRDYIPLVHPESRARMEQYHRWMPHLLFDFHEMGTSSTYFFQPGKPSAIHPLIPAANQEVTRKLAGYVARALDSLGSLYYSEEVFDDFFAGKGSTYTDLTGSVGILVEQASARGHRQEHPNGLLTFAFAIRNHVTTTLTALGAMPAIRQDLVRYRRMFFAESQKRGSVPAIRAYLFGSAGDPLRSRRLAELLVRHQIRVDAITRPHTVGGVTYRPGSAFVVDVRQPHAVLLTALFEQRTTFEDSLFYDISAWTLPLAYGLQTASLSSLPGDLAGEQFRGEERFSGAYRGPASPAAYVIPWSQLHAPRLLYRLLRAGVLVRAATQPFAAAAEPGGELVEFSYGALVVPSGIQRARNDTIASLLRQAVQEEGLTVYGITSGLTARGVDLGSDSNRPVPLPRVLVAAGTGVSGSDAGEIWHLLDRQCGMEVTLADPSHFGRIDLSRYTVVILPGGGYTQVDSASVLALKQWVERGGTLVAQENAVEWLSRKKLTPAVVRTQSELRTDTTIIRRPFGAMGDAEAAQQVNGAIVQAAVDRSHPLAYGIETDHMALCHGTALVTDPPKDPYATPLLYTARPLLSGYMSAANIRHLASSAAVAVTTSGSGRIVQMMDNTAFRGFWLGSERLLVNAVFFGSLLRPLSARGYR